MLYKLDEREQSSHSEAGDVGWCCREAAGLDRGASVQQEMMNTNIQYLKEQH